jgi:hypothetical protein
MNLATIDERIRALEDGENQELIDILLDIVGTLEDELGVGKKALKRRVRALAKQPRGHGQQRLNIPG